MYDFIIVGGSQSGLAMAYQLKKLNVNFLVVDASPQIGYAWLSRWDSLTLFTTKPFNSLPGLPFKGPNEYPNKHDVANYLQKYVTTFDLPLKLNTKVKSLNKIGENYQLLTNCGQFHCRNIIIATGPFHKPFKPLFANEISDNITQLHSKDYRNVKQLSPGPTLVVGGGDSGVQILSEISTIGYPTYTSGISSMSSLPQSFLGKTLWWWLTTFGILSLTKYSILGKQIKKRMQPVIGTNVKALLNKANIIPVGRTIAAKNTTIIFDNTQLNSIKNIIWATGYKPDFSWLLGDGLDDLSFDEYGYPDNIRGIGNLKGMYFIGLPWMYTRGSATLGGVGKDSEYLANYIKDQISLTKKFESYSYVN